MGRGNHPAAQRARELRAASLQPHFCLLTSAFCLLSLSGGSMVPVASLWLPIVLSAVIVFIASAIVHMVLPFHRSDLKRLPKEDEVMAALRPFQIPAGDYAVPYAGSPAAMRDQAYVDRRTKGPVAFM